ncbi:mitochondrial antiviral-signaling protein isoform X2 [Eublepharis macularius]|uniref:Mitochondrial antiviral-signaling protein isoform X2 n=1 Tax=Eublepharis macularius TaxID=481883 RepID=A0AA97JZ88_EUBMA|nr:mitochondrial antiviral-signaling protein isoform X2 [Eublepharis macularius]
MGFAENEVKQYLLRNLRRFQGLRVNQLLNYLPCLTEGDREEIRAHIERRGDRDSVYELFSRLWCRSGWLTDLISALEENNSELAEELRRVHESRQLSPQRSSSASSTPPAAANASQSHVLKSAPVVPSATSSDDRPLSPPRNLSRPARAQPPTAVNVSTPAPSASPQDVVDCRSPVQETKFQSWSSETTVNAEAHGEDKKLSNSTPNQQSRNAAESSVSLEVQYEKPPDVQAASSRSLAKRQSHSKEEMQSAKPVSSNSSAAAAEPEAAASTDLAASRNQPEETSYLSSDSLPPMTPRRRDNTQPEQHNHQAICGYQQENLLGDPTNNKPFSQQIQVEEEQKDAHGPYVPVAAAVAVPPTAPLLGQSPSRGDQLPQRSSKKEQNSRIFNAALARFRPLPSDFTGSSSTDVIPPSSPAAVSDTLSDGYSDDLKHPVQERELEGTEVWTCSELAQEKVTGNASWPSYGTPTNSREDRNDASRPSRDSCVFCSNQEEEDSMLSKPGVLVSVGIPKGRLDPQVSNLDTEYSGTSDRFRFSDDYSVESNSLMLSNSTQHSHSEEACLDPAESTSSRRNVTRGNGNASLDNHSDDSSIRTHTFHVEEPPSVDLAAAPDVTGLAFGNASQSPGVFSDSVAKGQPIKNINSPPLSNHGQRNSLQNESIGDAEPLLMSNSTALAVGFALTSLVAVAFGLYKKLKK